MSISGAIYAMLQAESTLTDEVSTRVYPLGTHDATYPYIIYKLNSRDRNYHLGGASGLAYTEAEIMIFTNGLGGAKKLETIRGAVQEALDGTSGTFDSTSIKTCRLVGDFQDIAQPVDNANNQVNVGFMQYGIFHSE